MNRTFAHPVIAFRSAPAAVVLLVILSFTQTQAWAGPVSWAVDADGLWQSAANWSSQPLLPVASDDVTIDVAGDRLITLSSGSQSINSLIANERVDVLGSELLVTDTARFSNNLRLFAGATLTGGRYTLTSGSSMLVADGRLAGVTFSGDASLSFQNSRLAITNGLTLNGTFHVNGGDRDSGPIAAFIGTQTVAGNATFSFDGALPNLGYFSLSGINTTLTLGPGVVVRGGRGFIGANADATDGARTLVTQGLIAADVSGQTISLNGQSRTLNVSNSGTLRATNGGQLDIIVASLVNSGSIEAAAGSVVNISASGWSNTGTLKATGGGALYLGGEFTLGPTSVLATAGGAVRISGTLLNSTLNLNSLSGSWAFAGGTVQDSTINATQGTPFSVSPTLSNGFTRAVVNGDLLLSGAGSTARVRGGLTLNGTAHLSGNQAYLTFGETQTIQGNATFALEDPGSVLGLDGTGTTLTFGTGVQVRGKGRIGTFFDGSQDTRTLINQGSISADDATGMLRFGADGSAFAVKNAGTLRATAGATLQLSINSLINTGTLEATAGGLINLDTSEAINDGLLRIDGGTVQVMGGNKLVTTPGSNTILSADLGRLILWRGFDNAGSFTWTGGSIAANGGKLVAPDSGVFNNLAGAIFNVSSAGSFYNTINSSGNAFNNAGDFSKTSSSITIFDVPFTNLPGGNVKVNDGTLVLSGGGVNQGTITVAKGATARFSSNFTHAAGSTLIAQGDVAFETAVFSLDGNLFIDGELSFNSASATIKGGTTATKLALVNSTATVAAGGSLQVNGGGINFGGTAGNTITLQPSATTPGKLMLAGNVSFTGSDGVAGINTSDFATGQTPGVLDLGGVTRTFTINDGLAGIDLAVSARVMNGSVIKNGLGTLRLDSPNAYTGGTTVSAGTLEVIDPAGLGSGSVTLGDATLSLKSDAATPPAFAANVNITGDATIRVDRISVGTSGVLKVGTVSVGGTRLAVAGANRSLEVANLVLSAANPTLDVSVPVTINGPVTQALAGTGFTKSTGTGKLTLAGTTANTYTGVTRVNAGSLELNKPANVVAVPGDLQVFGGSVKLLADGQVAATSSVAVANAGTLLDLSGHSQTLASLAITGASVLVGPTNGGTASGTAVLRVNGAFSITGGGKLDLANNRLIVNYDPTAASPITAVRSALVSAYANGAWTGPGIDSAGISSTRSLGYAEASDVLGAAGGGFGSGPGVDGSAVLVRYTLTGDANLDGVVDFLDLARLAQSYNVSDGKRQWSNGDLDYNGMVDFLDLAQLAQNYNTALPGATVPGASAEFEADLARAFANVPEPSLLGLLGICALAVGGRRRKPQ
jgi:fibronectin-binding autotransporter adhesin